MALGTHVRKAMKESSETKNCKSLVGGGYIDDLSKFFLINEDSIIKELKARFKKGKIYVTI